MPRKSKIIQREEDVLALLIKIGFPLGKGTEFKTHLRQKRLAHILMAVADLSPSQSFSEVKFDGDGNVFAPRTRDIIRFINKHYKENIADSSYDDVRRKNLDFLVEASLVVRSANRPEAATNDGTRGYALNPEAVALFTSYGTEQWDKVVEKWRSEVGSLAEKLARPRKQNQVKVKLPDGDSINLSSGAHNILQKQVLEEFLPRFLKKPRLLYLGDTSKKMIIHDESALADLGLGAFEHDALPDIVVYDEEQKWLYFIEAVHSSNPVTRLRHLTLERLSKKCPMGKVYVSAFLDRDVFRKWIGDLSWETEVWIASDPTHMIHFNGDRFLGPH